MQHLEVSGAVRPLKWPLGVKWLNIPNYFQRNFKRDLKNSVGSRTVTSISALLTKVPSSEEKKCIDERENLLKNNDTWLEINGLRLEME